MDGAQRTGLLMNLGAAAACSRPNRCLTHRSPPRSGRRVPRRADLSQQPSSGVATTGGERKAKARMAPQGTYELLFWIADKVVIALLLVVITFLFNHLLERSRARLAFGNEIAKQRVVRIGEVWSGFYESEAATRELLRAASSVIENGGDVTALKKLMPLEDESRRKAALAQQMADANRFWLGETLYERMRTFHDAQRQMIKAFGSADRRTYEESEVRLNETKMSVVSFVENPF